METRRRLAAALLFNSLDCVLGFASKWTTAARYVFSSVFFAVSIPYYTLWPSSICNLSCVFSCSCQLFTALLPCRKVLSLAFCFLFFQLLSSSPATARKRNQLQPRPTAQRHLPPVQDFSTDVSTRSAKAIPCQFPVIQPQHCQPHFRSPELPAQTTQPRDVDVLAPG